MNQIEANESSRFCFTIIDFINIKTKYTMGLFDNLKARKYWREHEEERKQIECEGAILLVEFNELIAKLNVTPDVMGYVQIRKRLFFILDWFIDLENRKCPYQLIGGAINKQAEIARVFNYGLNYAVKREADDFDIAIEQLIVDADNYFECKKAINQQKNMNGISFNGTGARFVAILENHFYQDNFIEEPLIACGIPEEIVMSRNTETIDNYKPTFSIEQKDDFNAYFIALKERYRLAHSPLIDVSSRAKNINLHDHEIVYDRINSVTLHEEVIVHRNVNYGGFKWSYGMARGGNMNYTTNVIKDFCIQDIGAFYITNQRILYVGNQNRKTISINISSIVSYELFKDGVLLRIANKNNGILFKFEPIPRYEGMLILQDGLNHFISIVERIIGDTTDKQV